MTEDTMKRAHRRIGLGATLTLALAGLLAAAPAVASASTQAPNACSPQVQGPARVGPIAGIVSAVPVTGGCQTPSASPAQSTSPAPGTSDVANGTPPLIFHGGAVMGTRSTGPVVVTPIFWNPAGHPIPAAYKNIISTYLAGVAAASGQHSNVYSTLNEYYGSNGNIRYRIKLGTPVNDTSPLPRDGCTLNGQDRNGIYADNSGYDACLDDDQVIAETDSVVTAHGLPRDLAHIYVMFLPKHVESCFFAGSTTTSSNFCTINYQPSAAYCAYHSQAPSGAVYANLAFPIYGSPTGFTCGSDAIFPVIQTPNGNPDADTEVSPTSHEIMEAITDPDTSTGWYDSSGFENGDECAYIFGPTLGTPGQLYNQVINHRHYLTQEEFSNRDFFMTGGGCLQSE
jgi:hypothetical protein